MKYVTRDIPTPPETLCPRSVPFPSGVCPSLQQRPQSRDTMDASLLRNGRWGWNSESRRALGPSTLTLRMRMCMCLGDHARGSAQVHGECGGQRLLSGVLLNHSSFYFWGEGARSLLTNLGLIGLSPLTPCWSFRCALICLTLNIGAGYPSSGPPLSWKALNPLPSACLTLLPKALHSFVPVFQVKNAADL